MGHLPLLRQLLLPPALLTQGVALRDVRELVLLQLQLQLQLLDKLLSPRQLRLQPGLPLPRLPLARVPELQRLREALQLRAQRLGLYRRGNLVIIPPHSRLYGESL